MFVCVCMPLCLTFLISASSCSTRPCTAVLAPVTPVKLTCTGATSPHNNHQSSLIFEPLLLHKPMAVACPVAKCVPYQVQKSLGSLGYALHPLGRRGGRGEQHLNPTASPSVNKCKEHWSSCVCVYVRERGRGRGRERERKAEETLPVQDHIGSRAPSEARFLRAECQAPPDLTTQPPSPV